MRAQSKRAVSSEEVSIFCCTLDIVDIVTRLLGSATRRRAGAADRSPERAIARLDIEVLVWVTSTDGLLDRLRPRPVVVWHSLSTYSSRLMDGGGATLIS